MDTVSKEILDMGKIEDDFGSKMPSSVREQCVSDASQDDVVFELTRAFNEALEVIDVKPESTCDLSSVGANDGNDLEMATSDKDGAVEHAETQSSNPLTSSPKCLCKCATFPLAESKEAAQGSKMQANASYMRSVSLPEPRKLISALKGGREKEGLPLKKLGVSWAPDVYDPPPSSVSHLPKKKSNQQYKNNKKYYKGKQKGKNSRSSKKDKKHHHHNHREGGERAESSFTSNPIAISDDMIFSSQRKSDPIPIPIPGAKAHQSEYNSTMDLLDFDNGVDSPDSNCGSSFLRKSRGNLHFPYAEAT